MTPFDTLGVPRNCSVDDAKATYRKLASKYHPDKYKEGTRESAEAEAKFKEVKEAWELIDGGYRYEEPAKSSFGSTPPPRSSAFNEKPQQPRQPYAGKPAPGYEARRTAPVLPHTYVKGGGYRGSRQYAVKLEITEDQAFEGCTVPFWHDGTVRDYVVRPGTSSRVEMAQYSIDAMIGRSVGVLTIEIELVVVPKHVRTAEPTRDAEMDLPLCALGLFTGGRVTVLDHLNEKVTITIPPGHNPAEPIKVPERGYGELKRGTLVIKIVPIFKAPNDLNQHELLQLRRLNEMTR